MAAISEGDARGSARRSEHEHGATAPHVHDHEHGQHGHGHDHGHGHEHSHGEGSGHAQTLWSVGLDVGSSTTHLTISRLTVGRPDSVVHRKPEVLERHLVYRSPIVFTPFLDDVTIDAAAIERLVADAYGAVGLEPRQIDTG